MDEKLTRKITQDDFVTEKMDVIKNNLPLNMRRI